MFHLHKGVVKLHISLHVYPMSWVFVCITNACVNIASFLDPTITC